MKSWGRIVEDLIPDDIPIRFRVAWVALGGFSSHAAGEHTLWHLGGAVETATGASLEAACGGLDQGPGRPG